MALYKFDFMCYVMLCYAESKMWNQKCGMTLIG